MAVLIIDGKDMPFPDDIAEKGVEPCRDVLVASGYPGAAVAHIEIKGGGASGAPLVITATKRPMGKAAPAGQYDEFLETIMHAREYVNPAIALAHQVEIAERDGDSEFFERIVRSGQLERAVSEGGREGKDVQLALQALGHATPISSKMIPVGF